MNKGIYFSRSMGSTASGDLVMVIATSVDVNSASCGVS